jgi:DNA-binding LacI/PurR family transcriptional regulator
VERSTRPEAGKHESSYAYDEPAEENASVATLEDVARAAGVSRSTVSYVFNNPARVGRDMRLRVEEAARRLGFAGPDPKGRLLRAGKVNAIGIIAAGAYNMASMFTGYFPRFMAGVAEVCDERGASLTLVSGLVDDKTYGIRNALVDGFILSRPHDAELIESLTLRKLPFVVIDIDGDANVSSVNIDARSGCRAAARHLLDLGHRRFAIMSFLRDLGPAIVHPPAHGRDLGVAGMPLDQQKLLGYSDALASAGIDIDTVPIVQAHPWDRSAAGLVFDGAPDATAILAMADLQAIAVIEEARRRGLAVPGDLSVVGFNDIPEAAQANLTTVDSNGAEKGRLAARLVFAGGPVRHEKLPTALVIRGTTAPPAKRLARRKGGPARTKPRAG